MGVLVSDTAETPSGQGTSGAVEAHKRVGEIVRGRYRLLELIGKGGMALVYRAMDTTAEREVALKQLSVRTGDKEYASSASLFEREFWTLSQLSHPRIIEVYDFGTDECGPFYTMELLDGGDLRRRAPLPWQEACRVAHAICSSLALLHSRRLVHRDVTPSNVRLAPDGQAKLIDFGAMVPMGPGGLIVGTPQFMAPEVALRSSLDGRADLFSLGATLYYALTRSVPFPVKHVSELAQAWKTPPLPPSRYAEGIPEALDGLVLALLGLEPAARPRTAFEVMQRLAALGGLRDAEPAQVSRAYLSTPVVVGRDDVMRSISGVMQGALATNGASVLVRGAAGLGRTRVLDAGVWLAQTFGARVLRASGARAASGAFRLAQRLAQEMVDGSPGFAFAAAQAEGVEETLFENAAELAAAEAGARRRPRLRDFRAPGTERYALQTALRRWFSSASREQPLAIAVDDLHRVDEPSLALLGALASELDGRKLCILATAESGAEPSDRLAFDVFAKHATALSLEPLSRQHSERLFESVFGDVPNVAIVSERIHVVARGNPRDAMELAQHLCDRGAIRYEGGAWTLPARVDPSDLPRDAQAGILSRRAALTPLARRIAEIQALATHKAFSRDDYVKVSGDAPLEAVDAAITELVSGQIVTSDGLFYSLTHGGWNAALVEPLSVDERTERHRALVGLYEGRLPMGVVQHALLGGLETRALDELAPILPGLPEATNLYAITDLGAIEIAETFERALDAAERIGRSPLELNHLRRWLAALSVVSDDRYYFRVAPAWLARLKTDSGYELWQELAGIAEPGHRLSQAMQGAFARYAATAESDRVYRPDEAVKGLAHFVGISIAIGSSRVDLALVESLPALLEPFAPISPLVDIIWKNSIAAREMSCRSRWEKAHAGWIEVFERLAPLAEAEAQFVGVFQRAVAYALGANEATIGMVTAAKWADLLDDDPAQRVNGLYIRRIVRLEAGDLEGAERCRKQAEVLTLQARARQMFANLNWVELMVWGTARDLTGVKECEDRIRVLANRSASWIPYLHLAEGLRGLCCDDFEAANRAFEATIALTAPSQAEPSPVGSAWCLAAAGQVEALVGLGKSAFAATIGESVLAACARLEIDVPALAIARALAIAEAKLGHAEKAAARVEAVIQKQMALGVGGLHLGASYEARARVAILAGDRDVFDRYARLAAQEYRQGGGSALEARFERLVHQGLTLTRAMGAPADFQSTMSFASGAALHGSAAVSEILKHVKDPEERARRVLAALCELDAAPSGHLFALGNDGPRLIASHGPSAPTEELRGFIVGYAESLVSDEGATMVMTPSQVPTCYAGAFVDEAGHEYRPMVLPAEVGVGGEVRHVAVLLVPRKPDLDDSGSN